MAFTPQTPEEQRRSARKSAAIGLGGLGALGVAYHKANKYSEAKMKEMFGDDFFTGGAARPGFRRPSNVDEGGGTMEEKMAYRAKRDTGPEGDIARRKLDQIKRARAEAEGKTFRARVKKGFSGFVSKVAGFFKKKPIAKVAMLMSAREELQSIIALDATGSDYAMAGISGYAGLKAIHASTPRLLGKQRFYHGTSKQNAEKIIKEGLDPEMGGKNGASAHVGSSSYVKNSTGHVHVTPSKRVAAAFSHLHGSGAGKGDPKQALAMLKGALLGTAGPGAIVSGHLDYDRFQRDFHLDPDMGGGQAYRTKTKIGTESIGSSVTKGVSAGSIAKYVKANPGRFAAGAGLAAAGGAGLAYGASRLLGKKPVSNMSAADELDSIIQLAAWTRKEGKSRSGGLNEKGRKSYERENPGSDLKAPSKEAGNPRRASFCARMSGMKKKLTSSKTANDPDSRINKSLKAWNCSAREELNTILFAKKGGDYKRHWSQKKTDRKGKKKCADCGETPCECHTYSAREELDVIRFGLMDKLKNIFKKPKPQMASPEALKKAGIQVFEPQKMNVEKFEPQKMNVEKFTPKRFGEFSARDQLDEIQFGYDLFGRAARAGAKNATVAAKGYANISRGYRASVVAAMKNPESFGKHSAQHWGEASAENIGMAKQMIGIGKNLRKEARQKLIRDSAITAGTLGATGAGIAYANRKRELSAREELGLSVRDQLNTILMGVDVRPRDPMGRYDQAEDGAPNPQHMKVVYAAPQEQAPPSITGKNMGKLAAGGAAFMGGGMALQHLIEKLKKLKK